MSNTNCLVGMKCPNPECKSEGPFKIVAMVWATVSDQGVEETEEHEWEDKSTCICRACTHLGTVGEFRGKKLRKKFYAPTGGSK